MSESTPTYFGFDMDEQWEQLWYEAERTQDGGSGHHLAYQAASPEAAAQFMVARLVPFIARHMYPSDEDGYRIEASK